MDKYDFNKIVSLVRADVNPALGCTEPVAVAYAASVAKDHIKSSIDKVEVGVSKNIFKNGKSVKIPNTGRCGLDLAAALGLLAGKSEYNFLVLKDVKEEDIEKSNQLLESGKLSLDFLTDSPSIFVRVLVKSGDDEIDVQLADAHTHIERVIVNGELVYEDVLNMASTDDLEDLKKLTIQDLLEISETIPYEMISFIEDGVEMNMEAANSGVKDEIGLSVGRNLNLLQEKGLISVDASTKSRILTAAAADMRMGGGSCPVMTSGGSGNQGIGVIIPIVVVAEDNKIENEKRNRAVFFAHALNKYVKLYSGKLSGMCGCAIGAGVGAAAGITWMLGGNKKQVEGACNNLFANMTGMICDGAKDNCSLKLSSCAGEAVLSAYLSLNNVVVSPKVGIIGESLEETIANIGKLSHEGFGQVDKVMLDIINK